MIKYHPYDNRICSTCSEVIDVKAAASTSAGNFRSIRRPTTTYNTPFTPTSIRMNEHVDTFEWNGDIQHLLLKYQTIEVIHPHKHTLECCYLDYGLPSILDLHNYHCD